MTDAKAALGNRPVREREPRSLRMLSKDLVRRIGPGANELMLWRARIEEGFVATPRKSDKLGVVDRIPLKRCRDEGGLRTPIDDNRVYAAVWVLCGR